MKRHDRGGEKPARADLSDSILVSWIRKRDEESLSVVYDRYSRRVFSLIVRIVGGQEEAEEILQDVFFQLWQQASNYDENRGPLLAWLMVVARSRAIDHFRSKSSGRLKRSVGQNPPFIVNTLVQELNKEEEMIAAEKSDLIRNALGTLPSSQREAIELAYFEGLSQSEIAEKLTEALGTVKTRIRLGMMKLREALAPHLKEIEP